MVVLGEPGAGKTVAVHLFSTSCTIVRRWQTGCGPTNPFRSASTRPDGTAADDFTTWLSHHLSIDYGLNPRVSHAMST